MTADAPVRFARFGLRTECPRCGAHLPVDGPVPLLDCADCGERVEVPQDLLSDLADTFEEGWPEPIGAGIAMRGSLTWRWTAAAVDAPACPACGGPLEDAVAAAGDAAIRCGACAALVPTFPAPPALRARTRAVQVIGGEADLSRDDDAVAPVAMTCPQCGAGLSITHRHQRVCPCEFCGSSVHLPDAVWRALHPPRTVVEWTVRFEGPSRAAVRAEAEAAKEAKRREDAENKRKKHAEREAQKARAAAERAEQAAVAAQAAEAAERRRNLLTAPLVIASWAASIGGTGAMAFATLTFVLGASRVVRLQGWVIPAALWGTGAVVAVAWALATLTLMVRGGGPALRSLLASGMHLLICAVPLFGPFAGPIFALSVLWRGRVQLDERRRAPVSAAAPMLLLMLGTGTFLHVGYAWAADMTLLQLFRWLIEHLPSE